MYQMTLFIKKVNYKKIIKKKFSWVSMPQTGQIPYQRYGFISMCLSMCSVFL